MLIYKTEDYADAKRSRQQLYDLILKKIGIRFVWSNSGSNTRDASGPAIAEEKAYVF